MFVKMKVPFLDVMNNPMFKDVKKDLLAGTPTTKNQEQAKRFGLKDDVKPINMTADDGLDLEAIELTLYKVFDKRSQKRFILAKNFDKDTLWEKDWKFLPEGFPLFPLIFNEIPPTDEKANSYPLSDVVPMLPQLKELSKLNLAIMRHRKRSGMVIAGRRGAINSNEITNITQARDLEIVTGKHWNNVR